MKILQYLFAVNFNDKEVIILNTAEEKNIKDSIKTLEHKEKYSKNPLEKRQLRSQIGKLQRKLKTITK